MSVNSVGCPVLDCQHLEMLETIDTLLAQLKAHNEEENICAQAQGVQNTVRWRKHLEKHDFFRESVIKLKHGLISHINNDDCRDLAGLC